MPNVLIFAGAGASKAVNAEKFPTTVQFFERLPDHIVSNKLFSLVVEFLRRTDSERTVDIEEVLWELQELRAFAESFRQQSSLIGYGLSSNRFLHMVLDKRNNQNFGVLGDVVANLKNLASTLIGEINAVVYDLYNYEPAVEELKDNWLYLFDKLGRDKSSFNVFTTNYDLVIEAAAAMRGRPPLDEFAGWTGRVSKRLDIDRWKSSKTKGPLLTKLHGSINWKFSADSIQVGDAVYTGDHKKQAIIYPGFKGQTDSSFFLPLHNFLGDCFENADILIFIGFAFRDEYINELVSDRVRPGSAVYVVNPADKLRFPVRRLQAKMIKDGFTRAVIDDVWKDISTKTFVKTI